MLLLLGVGLSGFVFTLAPELYLQNMTPQGMFSLATVNTQTTLNDSDKAGYRRI